MCSKFVHTANGGQITIAGKPLPIVPKVFEPGTRAWDCPLCGKGHQSELVDFVTFGMLDDRHDILFNCYNCHGHYVIEVNVPVS